MKLLKLNVCFVAETDAELILPPGYSASNSYNVLVFTYVMKHNLHFQFLYICNNVCNQLRTRSSSNHTFQIGS